MTKPDADALRAIADELVATALEGLTFNPASVEVVRDVVLAAGASLHKRDVEAALRRLRKVGRAMYHRSRWHWPTRSRSPAGWTKPDSQTRKRFAAQEPTP